MSTIRPEFHSNIVNQTLNDIFYQRSNFYYFLGKIDSWGAEDTPPESADNSSYNDVTIRDNILYLKRIAPGDISLVAKSYTWFSGTVYDHWDDRVQMQDKAFHVVTSDFNVYKCLDNNNRAESTVMPVGASLFPIRTSDGYLWKYMYNIPIFKRQKFLSRGFMPVQKALSDNFYNKGAIESVVVTNEGSGYADVPQTSITVTGTTTGSGATAEIVSVGSLGEIVEAGLNITLGGSEYTEGANVTIVSSTGNGAVVTADITDGVVTGFTVVSSGVGYTEDDTILITVGDAVLVPEVLRSNGEIFNVKIMKGGAGYVGVPTVTINQSPATGTGKYDNATAVVKSIMYNGSIVNVTVEDPGTNYPVDTNTTIVVSGDGEGAEFTPVIYDGRLVDIIIDNPGSGYSYINIDIVGTGIEATAVAVLATSDFLSDQSQVEQVAVRGAIYCVVVTNSGNNYSKEATLVIDGDGTGAAGYPVVVNDQISHIVMTSFGSGYTWANISIQDPNRPSPNNFVDAVMYPVLPPTLGHGYDAVTEMYGDSLCVFTLIKSDLELNLISQDYRQYGLLANPVDIITNKRVTENTSFVIFDVLVNDTQSLTADDVLICNKKKYRVVSIDGNTIKVQQLNQVYAQPSGIFYNENDTAIQYIIQRINSVPNLNKYSGDLLYATNNTPFTPTSEQTIAIRTYIKI